MLKVFKLFSVVDSDMHFHTMSIKEWGIFVSKLQFKGDTFNHRNSRDVFWRAQGAFDSVKEREEFLTSLGASEDMNEGMDRGSNQEMTYPEFAEAVCRISHQLYLATLEPPAVEALDYASPEFTLKIVGYFNTLCDTMKTTFQLGP